jgi:hypothetical protein
LRRLDRFSTLSGKLSYKLTAYQPEKSNFPNTCASRGAHKGSLKLQGTNHLSYTNTCLAEIESHGILKIPNEPESSSTNLLAQSGVRSNGIQSAK